MLGQMRSISAEPSLKVSFDAASNARMPPLQIGQFRAIPLPSGIHKKVHNAAKREKRNYTDSSNSEHSDTKTDGHRQGQIFRLPKGSSKEYGVYWKGKKITFGDPSMPNHQNNDKKRESFNARHKCSEKKDKGSAGYWACRCVSRSHFASTPRLQCRVFFVRRVWRKGFKSRG